MLEREPDNLLVYSVTAFDSNAPTVQNLGGVADLSQVMAETCTPRPDGLMTDADIALEW